MMGRPFARELAQLPETYAFARDADIGLLCEVVRSLQHWPLLVVGSGGSLSACALVARLHLHAAGLSAEALTPLEFVRRPAAANTAVLFVSASGRNRDILAAVRHAIRCEMAPMAALVTRPDSPLAHQLAGTRHARPITITGPVHKDGFLATNSLLLTATVLARGYGIELPPDLPAFTADDTLVPSQRDDHGTLHRIGDVVALASAWSWPAAVDLESKWGEIGLGSVVVVDPRNFAHGRHTGLVRRERDVTVLGFSAGADPVLDQSLALLPPRITVSRVGTPLAGASGSIDLLVRVMRLTGRAGETRNVDPGRPAVPGFGRRLYHAGIPSVAFARTRETAPPEAPVAPAIDSHFDLWIQRKVTPTIWTRAPNAVRDEWRTRAHAWCERLAAATFRGVILDYDGTLCEESERFTTPRDEIGAELSRLLRARITLAIATGRGSSAALSLRRLLPDQEIWPQVIVITNNGAIVRTLADVMHEDDTSLASPILQQVAAQFAQSPVLRFVSEPRPYPQQLTLRERTPLPSGQFARLVAEAIPAELASLVRVHGSGSTIDITEAHISKQCALTAVAQRIGSDFAILSIGDQGQAGGNDHALLQQPFGLSVDRTAADFDSCWNIAQVGALRTDATLAYLRALQVTRRGARFHLATLTRSRSAAPRSEAPRLAPPGTDDTTQGRAPRSVVAWDTLL